MEERADFEFGWVARCGVEAGAGQGQGQAVNPAGQGCEGLVVDVGGVPVPGDDLAAVIDYPAQLEADDPAMTGIALAPGPPGVDQLDAIDIDHRGECRVDEEAVGPAVMGALRTREAWPLRQPTEEVRVVPH